jgi:hypothetical protein
MTFRSFESAETDAVPADVARFHLGATGESASNRTAGKSIDRAVIAFPRKLGRGRRGGVMHTRAAAALLSLWLCKLLWLPPMHGRTSRFLDEKTLLAEILLVFPAYADDDTREGYRRR